MELYKIIARCTNNSTEITLDWEPENFKGIKITQKFSWQNPVGYTPTFSLETMKIIGAESTFIENIFDIYGLQSIVYFDIYKLNSTATDYTEKGTFRVDFESYIIKEFYTEFALIAVTCLSDYDKIKNTTRNFTGATMLTLPTTQNYIN